MQVAAIVPISLLNEIKSREYHLVLAQWLLKSKEYRKFYQDQASQRRTLIVDNGASEKESVPLSLILEQCKRLSNSGGQVTLALPDHLWNFPDTVRSARQSLKYLKGQWRGKTMAIPQGHQENWQEWVQCVNQLRKLDFDVWGITRGPGLVGLGEFSVKQRMDFAKLVHECDDQHRPMHFLGVWTDPWEIYQVATDKQLSQWVVGIDSKIFFKLARDQVYLKLDNSTEYYRPGQTTNMLDGDLNDSSLIRLRWNLKVADQWAQGELPTEKEASLWKL